MNGVSTNGGSRYIAATQGFWVKVSNGFSSGSLTINNQSRVVQNINYRKGDHLGKVIKIISKSGVFSDETAICFINGASNEFDNEFDAAKLFAPHSAGSAFYTVASGQQLAINSLPEISDELSLDLYSKVISETEVTLEADFSTFEPYYSVFLEDRLENKIIDFKAGNYTYQNNLNDPDNRFVLHLIPVYKINNDNKEEVVSVKLTDALEEIQIYTTADRSLIVNTHADAIVYVYDMAGKLLTEKSINEGFNKIVLNENNGAMLVKVVGLNQTVTQKVVVY